MTIKTEVFKKWRKNKAGAGFAAFYNWTYGDKVVIEIADVDPNTNKIIEGKLATCYIDPYEFLAYLHAEITGNAARGYPNLFATGRYHGITWFGGRGPARVFKIENWNFSAKEPDTNITFGDLRRFKAGEFEIKQGANASEPDYSRPLANSSIQMKLAEMSHLYHCLLASQQAYETAITMSGLPREEYKKQQKEREESGDDRQY